MLESAFQWDLPVCFIKKKKNLDILKIRTYVSRKHRIFATLLLYLSQSKEKLAIYEINLKTAVYFQIKPRGGVLKCFRYYISRIKSKFLTQFMVGHTFSSATSYYSSTISLSFIYQ